MKRLLIATMLLASIVLVSSVASAGFLNMDTGVTYQWKYRNWELLTDSQGIAKDPAQIAVGDKIWGLLRVSSVYEKATATQIWSESGDNQEVTGYFRDLTVSSIVPAGAGFDVYFTGGVMDLYFDSTPDAGAPTPYIGGVQANGYIQNFAQLLAANPGYFNDDNGVPFLSVAFDYGIVPGDTSTTQLANVSALSDPLKGDGAFYADAVGGYLQHLFDSNIFHIDAANDNDFYGQSIITTQNPVGAGQVPETFGFTYASEDPAELHTVPEPSTFLLIGVGLCSCLLFRRKRT